MERVIGIEPTTFSLGSRSGGDGADEDDRGQGRASGGNSAGSGKPEHGTCDDDEGDEGQARVD